MPRISIITPTLCRSTLPRMLRTLAAQTFADWELCLRPDHPKKANDYGHSLRRVLSMQAQGDYLLYLDDDDYLAHPSALKTIVDHLTDNPAWLVFGVMREGHWFYPSLQKASITLSSFVAKRELAVFPEPDYSSDEALYQTDWLLVESLAKRSRPVWMRSELGPMVIITKPNRGVKEL